MGFTTPSDKDYHDYLHNIHGLNCDNYSDKCIHIKTDPMSEHIRTLPIFMTAKTNISGGKEIRVVGIFNHFFVIKNSLNSK